jgi:hypothetical protein
VGHDPGAWRSYCRLHYHRWWRTGSTELPERLHLELLTPEEVIAHCWKQWEAQVQMLKEREEQHT